MNSTDLWTQMKAGREELVAFAQKLVQTPSPSGQEGDVAALMQAEMLRLSYDQVWVDEAGNVIGRIAGEDGPSLMLNGHMDHVAADNPSRWRYPPFGAEIHQGELWGRGSVDMKGALAAMVYAGGVLKELGAQLPGDLYVAAVVQEEVGGLGARYLSRTLPVERAIVGEPSGNNLRRGHRGRVELCAHFEGRSVHASTPELCINPHYSAASFVQALRQLSMAGDPDYGASSVVPTRVTSEPDSANVTPSVLHLVLDWRNVPDETPEQILGRLESLQASCLQPGCAGRVELGTKDLVTYTGFPYVFPDVFPSFTTPRDHPFLLDARAALVAVLGRDVEVDMWRLASDGAHFAAEGVTVLGFAPGDDTLVHTVEERLPLDQLVESAVAYAALALV
ncbi:M20/M25/M40 family metallo-hydrolase [Chloroflexota bacterium]